MRILWAFDIRVDEKRAKFPLNTLDWRGTFPGMPGPEMPIMVTPRSTERVKVIQEAMRVADEQRPPMVSKCTSLVKRVLADGTLASNVSSA